MVMIEECVSVFNAQFSRLNLCSETVDLIIQGLKLQIKEMLNAKTLSSI